MVKDSKELLNNIYGTAPYYLEANQRVTVRRQDLYNINTKVNNFLGITDDKSTISLAEITKKLDYLNLNLQSLSTNLHLDITPDTDLTTFKQVYTFDEGYVGLKDVTLKITSDSIGLQEVFNLDINNTNLDSLNKTLVQDLTGSNKFFGAKTINIKVNLENSNINLNKLNSNVKITPTAPNVGFGSVTINPVLEELKVTPSMLSTENTIDILPVSDALGFKFVELPVQESDKQVDITLNLTDSTNTTIETFDIDSVDSSETTPVTFQYFIKILGKHEGIPATDVIDYVTFEGEVVDNHTAVPGDTIYVIDAETSTYTYYIFTGTNNVGAVIWEQLPNENILDTYYEVERTQPIGVISNAIAGDLNTISADADKFGFRNIHIKNPGKFDYTFNAVSKLISIDNEADTSLLFNFTDTDKAINTLTIPKVKATNKEISAQDIKEAILAKQDSIIIEPEVNSYNINDDVKILVPTLLNSIKVNLPTFDDGEFVARGVQDDIAILKTVVYNNTEINADTIDITFKPDSANYTKIEEAGDTAYYYIDKSAIQKYSLEILSADASDIDLYQAKIPSDLQASDIFETDNRLFTFKYPGNDVKYFIEFMEDFSISLVASSNDNELPDDNLEIESQLSFNNIQVYKLDESGTKELVSDEELNTLFTNISFETNVRPQYYGVKAVTTYEAFDYNIIYSINEDNVLESIITFDDDRITGLLTSQGEGISKLDIATLSIDGTSFNLNPEVTANETLVGKYFYAEKIDPESEAKLVNMITINDNTITFSNSDIVYYYSIYNFNNLNKLICFEENEGIYTQITDDIFNIELTDSNNIGAIYIGGNQLPLSKVLSTTHYKVDNEGTKFNVINKSTTTDSDIILSGTLYIKPVSNQ